MLQDSKNSKMFVIEHLEPKLSKWVLIEYSHISKIIGKRNLIFTNVRKSSEKLNKIGKTERKKISELNLKKACVLDPHAKKMMTYDETKKYNYFVFGGILGDAPEKGRTEKELTSKLDFPAYNIGKSQMSTDTAALVVKKIIDGKRFEDIKFIDDVEVALKEGESIILPFRYVCENGKAVFAEGLVNYLKSKRGF